MLATLRLLLPALIPSWRFFDSVRPSPRIEFALFDVSNTRDIEWHAFQAHVPHLPLSAMLKRLFWNPDWNDYLYSMSCAARLLDEPTRAREEALLRRVATAAQRSERARDTRSPKSIRVRIVVLKREGDRITRELMYLSAAQPLRSDDA